MKDYMWIILVIMVLISLGFDVWRKKKDKDKIDEITDLLMNQKYDKFDEVIEQDETKRHLPVFNYHFIKLNKEMMVGDRQKIEKEIADFEKLKLNAAQKEAFYSKAFYYFIASDDKENATKFHDLYMAGCKNSTEEIDMVFDTMISKGSKYLENALKEAESANTPRKIQLYSLISQMYENLEDEASSKKYLADLKQMIDDLSNQDKK